MQDKPVRSTGLDCADVLATKPIANMSKDSVLFIKTRLDRASFKEKPYLLPSAL